MPLNKLFEYFQMKSKIRILRHLVRRETTGKRSSNGWRCDFWIKIGQLPTTDTTERRTRRFRSLFSPTCKVFGQWTAGSLSSPTQTDMGRPRTATERFSTNAPTTTGLDRVNRTPTPVLTTGSLAAGSDLLTDQALNVTYY